MRNRWTQFYLLFWKNWKLQLRKKVTTAFEIILPALFCLVLLALRTLVVVTKYEDPTLYPSYNPRDFSTNLTNSFKLFGSVAVIGLAYTPNTNVTTAIMTSVANSLSNPGRFVLANGTSSEEEMVQVLQFNNGSFDAERYYLAGVVFENPDAYLTHIPLNISYKLRLKHELRIVQTDEWETEQVFPPFVLDGPRNKQQKFGPKPDYYSEGFLTLQNQIHHAVIKLLNPNVTTDPAYIYYNTEMQRFPYPPYLDDNFILVLQSQLPFLIMLSFIFMSLNIAKEVVHEKERKLKEAMKMMGLSNWLHWLAWFLKYLSFLAVTCILMTILLNVQILRGDSNIVLRYSNFGVLFVFLLLYAISIICFCFMVSVFFNKANAAAAAGGIFFFASYIPYSFIQPRYETMTLATKFAACILNNQAMALGMLVIGKWEGAGVGANWDNILEPVTVDDNFSLIHAMLMLIVDSILYIIIMWYVEAVKPGAFGIPQPPYFLFLPSYWCGTVQQDTHVSATSKVDVPEGSGVKTGGDNFEEEPKNMQAGIQIKNLTKSFKSQSGRKVAVNNMNMNMYDGQITALLGHNGAGKTTTMFMLTGFLPPSQGTALVNGYDIRKDIASVRSSLGLCPQHDILFDELTVEEHLYFFAKLKGCTDKKLEAEITYYIDTLGLKEKRKAFAKSLSGGQKRKLSVGIALIGDSKIVILDEPTSGMDPSARRHMWDVLQAQRAGRTMILSTHFMDEADHLGDRIAIMADGVLQCSGSSIFLKNRYGAGYHMVMSKKATCDVQQITSLLQKHVPQAKLDGNIGAEVTYILPHENVSSFSAMFREIEDKKDELGIQSYGASVTTMEEVFMKVGERHSNEEDQLIEETLRGSDYVHLNNSDSAVDMQTLSLSNQVTHDVQKNTGFTLVSQQFIAMFIKRVLYTLRNKVLTGSQIILPLLFTIFTVIILKTLPNLRASPSMPLNIHMYGKTNVLYYTGTALNSTAGYVNSIYQSQLSDQILEGSSSVREQIWKNGEADLKKYNFETIVAANIQENGGPATNTTVFFNAQPYHAAATALLLADDALLKHMVNESYSFAAGNHPLPESTISEITRLANKVFSGSSFAYASNLMFGMSFLASSFVVFLITERSRKIKHSQIVSGVKWYNFWLSTFCWDYINYIIPALLTVVTFALADIENLASISNGNSQPGNLIVLLMLFGCALLPNMYVLQFLFVTPATGYVVLTFYNILTGIVPQLVVTILALVDEKPTADVLDEVFVATLPNYNLGTGIANLYNNYEYIDLCWYRLPEAFAALNIVPGREGLKQACERLELLNGTLACCKDVPAACGENCLEWQANYFAWDNLGIGRPVVFLVIQWFFYSLLIVIIETEIVIKLFYMIRPKVYVVPQVGEVQEDDDVIGEKTKILYNGPEQTAINHPVVISGLTKFFPDITAVDQLYVGIPKGECFGLLGVNGAGKTTTFKMLTGDETVSGGTAYMNGGNIRTDIHDVQKSIGYCPQFDALIDQMTGEEMLYMYARLRGVPSHFIKSVVDDLLKALLLDKHAKKLTRDYSGGNKRKLSTAIALLGDPPIVFLDEPTTGMDPVARRMLWEALSKVRDSGKTLILTSHSMDECEALCTRMAIMVNGKFRCLGSTQHLKSKFGAGYSLVARLSYPEDGSVPDVKSLERWVESTFEGAVLKDVHQNLVQYQIPKDKIAWAEIFQKLEDNKKTLQIEDYSVSQTTLEQVFINFARSQLEPEDAHTGCSGRMRQTCCICCIPERVLGGDHMSSTQL